MNFDNIPQFVKDNAEFCMCNLPQEKRWLQFPSDSNCGCGTAFTTAFTASDTFAREHKDEFI